MGLLPRADSAAALTPLSTTTALPPLTEPPRRRPFSRFKQWLRHNASSSAATATDFITMVAAVELFRLSPVVATAIGATAGGVINFFLGRNWTYRRGGAPLPGQAFRYLIVSAASLGLNTAGEYLLAHRLGVQYVLARAITAVLVSNAWNYPMQRFFVFRRPAEGSRAA